MRTQIKRIRGSANLIGLTLLAESAFSSVLLTPLMLLIGLLPLYGRTMAELCELAAYLLIFAVPFLLMARVDGMSLGTMAGSGRPPRSVYLTAVLLSLGLSTVGGYLGGVLELILNEIGLSEPVEPYALPDSVPAMLLHILSIAILPPLLEELCYRGFYYKLVERTAGARAAIWVTAVLFWLGHSSITILPLALGFGLLGGMFRRRYESILPFVVGHIAVNLTYIVMNVAEGVLPYPIYALLSAVQVLVTLVLGVVGLIRLRAECKPQQSASEQGASRSIVVRAFLSSIPMLAALAFSVYYTIQNLEFIA